MGSLRRRLTAVTALVPQAAWSGACEDLRPGFADLGRRVTAAEETQHILFSPVGLVILGLLVLAILLPRLWLAIAASLPALSLCLLLGIGRSDEVAAAAMAEGCIATATPAILILLALVGTALVRAWRRHRRLRLAQ